MSTSLGIKSCELCEKPFNQEITYKRHVMYCQKQQGRQKTRRHSCRACKVAKTKCVAVGGDECERCQRKRVKCTYEKQRKPLVSTSDVVQATPPRNVDGGTAGPASDLQVAATVKESTISAIGGFVSPVILDHDDPAIFNPLITDTAAPCVDGNELLDNPSTTLSSTLSLNLLQTYRSHSLPHAYHLKIERNQDWPRIFRLDPYTSALLPNTIDKWVLRPASMPNSLSQSHSSRVISMLRSIPRMMARRETFPPFVHSHWQHTLPEPLANCMTIAQMFCGMDPGNSAFVWRTIRMEQERLATGTYDFSCGDLLAAIQSYLVYMIMRVEDETGQTAQDVPMLVSFKAMSDWCYHMFGGTPPQSETQYDPTMTWELWIFGESKRRCALLYFLVGRVFTIFTDNVCPCTSMPTTLPLPAPRSVWEARTRSAWSTAYQDLFQSERLVTFGDLVEEMWVPTEKLDEWHCGMDYLGSLLESATGMFQVGT